MALIEWDHKGTKIEDPSIGTVKFIMKHYGGIEGDTFLELESHFCKEKDLPDTQGSNKESNFYNLSENSEPNLLEYGPRFKCLTNPERDLKMFGNYDTSIAANLMVVFDKCNNKTSSVPCKSKEEIDEFMKFKYMIALWNSRNFI